MTPGADWRDLSDGELQARLVQRGWAADAADVIARKRDDETWSDYLDRFFERDGVVIW